MEIKKNKKKKPQTTIINNQAQIVKLQNWRSELKVFITMEQLPKARG